MSLQKYEAGKLNSILQTLFKKNASGVLTLKTQVDTWQNQRSCILLLNNGSLVYGDAQSQKPPSSLEICELLGKELNPNLINAALSVSQTRITDPNSTRELIGLLVTMRVFTWQEVETWVTNKIIPILEQFLARPGMAQWQTNTDIDLSYGTDRHGLNWSNIKQEILQRQQKWQQYAPAIPSMDAIPWVTAEQLQQITDPTVRKHLMGSANGTNTLLDIADKMGKDPLKVAKSYLNWVNNGWVNFGLIPQAKADLGVGDVKAKIQSMQHGLKTPANSATAVLTRQNSSASDSDRDLPIVLSVDDSPIIQTSIKRALQEQYKVLLAQNAKDALTMLNKYEVQLMLLDLTMPDIDGLEFCKLVRQTEKFQDLPIVMVTARDGLVNKMKGQIAGTNRYLTKPFEPEQLREIVREYVH